MNPIHAFGQTVVYMLAGMGLLYMFQVLGLSTQLVPQSEVEQVAQASYDAGAADAIMPFDKKGNPRKSKVN